MDLTPSPSVILDRGRSSGLLLHMAPSRPQAVVSETMDRKWSIQLRAQSRILTWFPFQVPNGTHLDPSTNLQKNSIFALTLFVALRLFVGAPEKCLLD